MSLFKPAIILIYIDYDLQLTTS